MTGSVRNLKRFFDGQGGYMKLNEKSASFSWLHLLSFGNIQYFFVEICGFTIMFTFLFTGTE